MQESGGASLATLRRAHTRLLLITIVAVAVDQVAKAIAVDVLEGRRRVAVVGELFGFRLVRNPGGAFGVLSQAPLLFFAASLLIVVGVLIWGWRCGQYPVALGLIAGGGMGNFIDRLVRPPGPMRGRVVDFIDFSFWPTFNFADVAIVLGVGLLLASEVRLGEES